MPEHGLVFSTTSWDGPSYFDAFFSRLKGEAEALREESMRGGAEPTTHFL
jgi:hypothetical protein